MLGHPRPLYPAFGDLESWAMLGDFPHLLSCCYLPTIDRRQKGGVLGRPNDGQPGISRVCANLTVHMVYVV